jgi:TatA/E family protein of Tat protein translocase
MFDVGLQELVVILVIALLVFGPSKLPEIGRMIGRALRELRRMNDEFRSTVDTAFETNGTEAGVPVPGSTPVGAGLNHAVDTSLDVVTAVTRVSDAVCATLPDEEGEPFCAQDGSRLFHRRRCVWVTRIAECKRLYFKRAAEASARDLLRCPVCEPMDTS